MKAKIDYNNAFKKKKRVKPMTICIASICNRVENIAFPAIVFCADRLLSSSVTFEHGNSKIKYIDGRAIIMEAGDATQSDLIIDKKIGRLWVG